MIPLEIFGGFLVGIVVGAIVTFLSLDKDLDVAGKRPSPSATPTGQPDSIHIAEMTR